MLKKSPGFTAIAVISLALGIGANTIIFSLAKAALTNWRCRIRSNCGCSHSGMPPRNSPIHGFWGSFYPGVKGGMETTSFSYPVYQVLRRENRRLEDLFAFKELAGYNRLTATINGHAQVVTGQLVSGNYYQGLGVSTALGRPIQPSDDVKPGQGQVAVISDGFWARAFGRSPSVIGKTIELNLIPMSVIGVNYPDFTGAARVQSSPDVFVPLTMQPILLPKREESLLTDSKTWWVQIMGRAKPGVSNEAAAAEFSVTLDQAIRATLPVAKDAVMPIFTLPSGSRGMNQSAKNMGTQIYVLLSLVGLVLLLACANIANLLLARSAARQREVSVRMALGASRGRILRQVFTESLVLSCLGGGAGFLLGYLGRNAIPRLMSNSWEPPQIFSHFDWKIFAFTAGISILTGLLFGLAPALQSTRVNVNTGLKDSANTVTKRRKGVTGKAIVVFQVSLSMLLLVGAGLFIRTLINLTGEEIGFRPENILLFHIQPPASRYTSPKTIETERQIEERLRLQCPACRR